MGVWKIAALSHIVLGFAALLGVSILCSDSKISSVSAAGDRLAAERGVTPVPAPAGAGEYRLIGWNDLGMHCMNQYFANLCILPPYNTLWAQLIRTGAVPEIVTSGVTVEYSIVDNTHSVGKTDFWDHVEALFGVALPPNIGLQGAGMAGVMTANGDHFLVEGVPLTPFLDSAPGTIYPYQLVHLVARAAGSGEVLAETTVVAPVSTEMRCDTCHADGMIEDIATGNIETNILTLHDLEESTQLMADRPVLCADCHADNALGLPGDPELPSLSHAIHEVHASEDPEPEPWSGGPPFSIWSQSLGIGRVARAVRAVRTDDCYLCHPGHQTQCLRDVMYSRGLGCTDCHGGTWQVADPSRNPWLEEPRCESCHGLDFAENPGTLYRNSVGHGGLYCEACHNSPHAIVPTVQPNDNLQTIAIQGFAGTLSVCTVCHAGVPTGFGPHGTVAYAMISGSGAGGASRLRRIQRQ